MSRRVARRRPCARACWRSVAGAPRWPAAAARAGGTRRIGQRARIQPTTTTVTMASTAASTISQGRRAHAPPVQEPRDRLLIRSVSGDLGMVHLRSPASLPVTGAQPLALLGARHGRGAHRDGRRCPRRRPPGDDHPGAAGPVLVPAPARRRPPHRLQLIARHLLACRGVLQREVEAFLAHPQVQVEQDGHPGADRPGDGAGDDAADPGDDDRRDRTARGKPEDAAGTPGDCLEQR